MKSVLTLLFLCNLICICSVGLFPMDFSDSKTESCPIGMVKIPAGKFLMGSENGDADERPIHTVYLDAFYIDTHEVTVGDYKKFIKATGHRALSDAVFKCSPTDKHPVVGVSWHDAIEYAKWIGKRLPTEAEWEKAARGGLVGMNYPWGESIDSSKANFNKKTKAGTHEEQTTVVGKYPSNEFGIFDMSGNVAEWCLDVYQKKAYTKSNRHNPIVGGNSIRQLVDNYKDVESRRVVRGGSWSFNAKSVRVANRLGEKMSLLSSDVGFRCVQDINK